MQEEGRRKVRNRKKSKKEKRERGSEKENNKKLSWGDLARP